MLLRGPTARSDRAIRTRYHRVGCCSPRTLARARGCVLGRASAAYRYSLANELEGRAGPLLKADRLKFERLRSALGQRREQRGVPLRQSYRDDTQKEDLTKHGKPDRFAGISW